MLALEISDRALSGLAFVRILSPVTTLSSGTSSLCLVLVLTGDPGGVAFLNESPCCGCGGGDDGPFVVDIAGGGDCGPFVVEIAGGGDCDPLDAGIVGGGDDGPLDAGIIDGGDDGPLDAGIIDGGGDGIGPIDAAENIKGGDEADGVEDFWR